jgi:hypothetical protein
MGAVKIDRPQDGRAAAPRGAAGWRASTFTAVSADLAAVLIFVLLGRRAHDGGALLSGTASVAWPFVCGSLLGWAVLLVAKRPPPSSVRGGLVVLAATVTAGMLLRDATGGGVQVSFVVVTTVVLAALLLGRRLLPSIVGRARALRG